MTNLALMLWKATGAPEVPADINEAVKLYGLAAERGDSWAPRWLAEIYEQEDEHWAETPTEKANATVMLDIFNAIERRDAQRLAELCHPDVELSWPAALPYGGTTRGIGIEPPSWTHTWAPLQPTEVERSMEPRVVASSGDEVVVLWRQRGRSPSGERFDGPVLALYTVHDRKLARAQMFYFDTPAVVEFLERAGGRAA
jgi:uncharacterized protein